MLVTFRKFFAWVWVAILLLVASGYWMLFSTFGGFAGASLYIHLMQMIGWLMIALFVWLFPDRGYRSNVPSIAAARKPSEHRSLISFTIWSKPKLAGSVHVGGIARRAPHPSGNVYAGGPQMVEISRDGKRVYWTNSLYSTWDNQFYPDGVPGAEVMANANASGGLELAKDYWVSFPDGYRAHQIRLEGGDCSTDSFCYPSV